jgi:hypothetical protein
MNPQKIMDGMAEKNRMLTQKNEELMVLSEKRAQAEREYSTALANEYLKLKASGFSVTLIDKVARGNTASIKYELDIAEAVMNACKESIKDIRTQIDSYRSLLAWQKAELLRAE